MNIQDHWCCGISEVAFIRCVSIWYWKAVGTEKVNPYPAGNPHPASADSAAPDNCCKVLQWALISESCSTYLNEKWVMHSVNITYKRKYWQIIHYIILTEYVNTYIVLIIHVFIFMYVLHVYAYICLCLFWEMHTYTYNTHNTYMLVYTYNTGIYLQIYTIHTSTCIYTYVFGMYLKLRDAKQKFRSLDAASATKYKWLKGQNAR